VDIALRGSDIRVAQHVLDHHQVLPALCQPGPKGVAQVMDAQVGATNGHSDVPESGIDAFNRPDELGAVRSRFFRGF
jgi:hypothetical protein